MRAAAIIALLLVVGLGPAQQPGRVTVGSPVAGVVALVRATAPRSDPYQGQFCAAVLVDRRTLLTAAHCVAAVSPDDILALIDGDNLCLGAPVTGRFISVSAISISADESPDVQDLALLTLAEDAGAMPRAVGYGMSVGVATAYGWGRGPNGAPSCGLQRIELTLPPQQDCPVLLADSPRPFSEVTMVCAIGVGGANTCQGDSGGPLIAGADDQFLGRVLGVVSWGMGCVGPGVYARVDETWRGR